MGEEGRPVLWEGSRRTGGGGGWGGGGRERQVPLPLESTPFWLERKLPRPTRETASDCRIMGYGLREPQEGRRCGEDLGGTLEEVWIR